MDDTEDVECTNSEVNVMKNLMLIEILKHTYMDIVHLIKQVKMLDEKPVK